MLGIFYLELLLLLRRSQEWLYPLAFFLIVITLFPLALSPDPLFLQKYIAGGIWIAALFASFLSVAALFDADKKEGHLEQMLLGQTPLPLLILTKLTAQWLVTQLPLIILTPLLGLLFHLSSSVIFALTLSLLLGTPILTCIGSLGVALTLGLRQQGVLLGLLILPLVMPILIFAVTMVQQSQVQLAISGPLAFLAGLSILVITFVPWVIAAALRIGMDD